jgi:hypothetical protein
MITARVSGWISLVALLLVQGAVLADALPTVRTMRVPDGGIQPQVVARGDIVHLLYFTGDPKAGDVQYGRSTDGGRTFGKPIRVNSAPGSAVAIGTIRGPRMAVAKGGRVHVAWMGSDRATPRAPGNQVPMLYARLNDAGDAFEPQRNVITAHPGLDGGGTVAADDTGNVYVVWHAPEKAGDHDEGHRCVWVARSSDNGASFAPESRANQKDTGVCACCGLEALAVDGGGLSVLYRGATEKVHRDMHLIRLDAQLKPAATRVLSELNVGICVMSTGSLAPGHAKILAAWEGRGEVLYAPLQSDGADVAATAPPGTAKNRKHPRLAVNDAGRTLLAWTEGTAWNRGGAIAWQCLDERLRPLGPPGRAEGLPAWGTAGAFATRDGFTIVY